MLKSTSAILKSRHLSLNGQKSGQRSGQNLIKGHFHLGLQIGFYPKVYMKWTGHLVEKIPFLFRHLGILFVCDFCSGWCQVLLGSGPKQGQRHPRPLLAVHPRSFPVSFLEKPKMINMGKVGTNFGHGTFFLPSCPLSKKENSKSSKILKFFRRGYSFCKICAEKRQFCMILLEKVSVLQYQLLFST